MNTLVEMDGRLMGLAWQNVTRQIVMSAEAPDFDTHVASALITTTTNAQRREQNRAYRQVYFKLLGLFALIGLLTVWWTSNAMLGWFIFWMGFVIVVGSSLSYFVNVRRVTRRNSSWDSAAAVIARNAAIAGDAKNAPLAQMQPTPASIPMTPEPTTVAGLYRPRTLIVPGATSVASMVISSISLVLVLGVFVVIVLASSFFNFADGSSVIYSWQYQAFFTFGLVASLAARIQQQRLRLPFSVTLQPQGVTWRQGLRQRSEPWSAAQALCVLDIFPPGDAFQPQRLYWLQFPQGALTWASTPLSIWTRAQRTCSAASSTDDAAWLLCAISAQRTGLPLRDMTDIATRLSDFSPRLENARQALAPATPMYLSAPQQARIAAQRAQRRHQIQLRFAGLLVYVLALAALASGLYFGAPVAYGAELSQAERSAPIFHASLRNGSNGWQTRDSDDLSLWYTGDGMHVTSCCDEFAIAPRPVSDGVIEVTLHTVGDFDLDEAGLVLRANPQTDQALYFTITSGGGWRLTRGSMKQDRGPSNELVYEGLFTPVLGIHTGNDVTNRLAVIMRGSNYTFFVNGRYIGSYHDNQVVGSRVGVYTDGTQDTSAFADFTFYPTPPIAFSWL